MKVANAPLSKRPPHVSNVLCVELVDAPLSKVLCFEFDFGRDFVKVRTCHDAIKDHKFKRVYIL